MKRKLQLAIPWFMALLLLISFNSWGQGTEDFTGSSLPASYSDGSFIGNNGITWNYVHARNVDTYPISGEGLMLRRSDEPSSLSATIPGGIGNFSVDTRKAYTGNTQRKLELLINGNVIAQHEPVFGDGADATVVPFIVNDINIPGDVLLTLRMYGATGNQQIVLDNISWTAPGVITQVATPAISPNGGNFYAPVEVSISSLTEDASIYYTIDGTDPSASSTLYTAPFTVSSTTTVKAIGIKAGLDNSNIASATFTFPAVTDLATIADLRAGLTDGTAYRLTGQALITAMDSYNNRKFIQDATGAIMIFDSQGIIDTDYSIGDRIQNVTGTLTLANNMLRFIPVADPGAAVSTGNPVTPTLFTINAITTNDQAKLVTLRNLTFTSAGNFVTGQNYTLTDGTNELVLRTDFFNADYIGTAIPSTPQAITGVIIQFNAVLQIVPRSLADMVTEPFTPFFQFSNATGNLPSWFGANRGIATVGDQLLVAKQSPVTIHVLDRFTGLETGTLNTTGIAGGFWNLNDIEASDDGIIFAANGVITNANGNFKVYQISSDPAVAPVLVLDYDVSGYPAVRLGDKITVVGNVAAGTAALYAADGSENRIFKWNITETGGVLSFGAPVIIPVTARGGSNVVAPLPNGNFYYTGTGLNVVKYSASGTVLGTIPAGIAPTGTTGMKYLGMDGNDEILAIYHYGAADGYLRVVRVPSGMPADASLIFRTPVLGPANSAGNGDVAFEPNADGMNVDLYVLDTSDGIGGYKSNILDLDFPDYSYPGSPVFAVSPPSRNFGTVLLGTTSAIQTFTIANTGAGTIIINPTDIVLSGPDAAEFIFTNITETAILDLNETVTFTVALAPQTAGPKSATITINDNLGRKDLHEVALSGLAVDATLYPPFTQDFNTTPFPPEFWTRFMGLLQETSTLAPATSVWVHGKFAFVGTVNNSAKINIYGTSPKHWLVTPPINLGDGTTDYELVFDVALTAYNSTNPPGTTGVDDKFAIIISTDNGTTWSSVNTLRLYDNAGSAHVYNNISNTGESVVLSLADYSGVVKIAFYGESTVSNADNDIYVDNVTVREVAQTPVFSITPTEKNFGMLQIGQITAPQIFSISNTGAGVMTINPSDITLTGPNAAEFILTNLTGTVNLAFGESATITVAFAPQTVGLKSATLAINDNLGGAINQIALSGEGFDATLYPTFVVDFNNEPFPPFGWGKFTGLLGETTALVTTTSGWAHHVFGNQVPGTNNSAYINVYNTLNHWLISPPIALGDGTTDYQLSFDIALTPWTGVAQSTLGPDDYIAAVISTDNGVTWTNANVLIDWDATDVISPTGNHIVLSLADYSGMVKVGFYVERPSGSTPDLRFYVDNFSVEEAAEEPVFTISPDSKDFGDVGVTEQSQPQTFIISNSGPGTLTVNAPVLDNTTDYILSYTAEDFPAELTGTETVAFTVTFAPQTEGILLGDITITYGEAGAETATVALTGTGVVRPAGSTCANPYIIASLPLVEYQDNTEDYGNDYQNSWINPTSNYLNGYDFVAQFTLDEAGYLSGNVAGSWTGVFILDACPDPGAPANVLAIGTGASGGAFNNVWMEAGTYFAIISTWPMPDFTDFTLNLSFNTGYTVTFVVEDESEVAITDAVVTFGGVTNDAGDYIFENVVPGTFAYTVVKEGYLDGTGNVVVVDADITETVTMVMIPVNPVIVSIAPVADVEVDFGTTLVDAIAALSPTTTITDSDDVDHTVTLSWTIDGYDGSVADDYTATGIFTLPEGVDQANPEIPLEVTAVVTVLEEPVETFAVTFNVNMTYAEGFDPETDIVYFTGDLLGWAGPGTDPDNQTMSRVGETMVWTKTLELEAGAYEYKYFLNAGWDGGEWAGGDNRALEVVGDMEVNDWFGYLTDPTSVTDPSLAQISIFPIPAQTNLNITSPLMIREVRMIDMLGQVVYNETVSGMQHQVNVSQHKNGIYFIQILTDKGMETRRIQIQR